MLDAKTLFQLKLRRDCLYKRLEPLHMMLIGESDAKRFWRLDKYIHGIEKRIARLDKQLGSVNI